MSCPLSPVPASTSDGVEAASDLLGGDWDADGTESVHLPRDLAVELLTMRGWERVDSGRRWIGPDGISSWYTAEALQIALTGEALVHA